TIVTSDISPGKLTVLTPTYTRACYLEGTVLNGCDNNPMFGASITINAPDPRVNTTSNLLGIFKTGYLTPGNYTATISKPGFASQTVSFTFETAQTTILNVILEPLDVVSRSGSVINALTGAPVPNATVTVHSSTQTFYAQTDASGNFVVNCIANDAYTATAGTWGYLPLSLAFNGSTPLTLPLQPGYYDDFELDYGWESTGTAPGVGHWVLGEPEGTYTNQGTTTVNPEFDMNTDNNDQCYMTGNGGGQAGSNDVDEGNVVLTTPPMVLGQYQSAKLSFYYWFFNYFPQNQPANDKFIVNAISNGQTVNLLTQNVSASQWRFSGEIPLENYITLSDEVRIEFITADDNPGHWVEAAIDIFNVEPSNPFSGVQNNLNANALIEAIPNPSGYDFGIQYDWGKSEEELVFEVRNMVGQVVYQTPLSNSAGRINCGNNFTSGVYFAILRSGTQSSAVKKLIKG
ncbi:MAG: carboxypeptidase regulatory-like domain-containing protein, partial [Saprospiraceae bacterium]|nr:carboxypeptidase regulatory-like domain-containing protein [Saprospiraceae bacterium]